MTTRWDQRIEELEKKFGKGVPILHTILVPGAFFLGDETDMTEARRQALEKNPAPRDNDLRKL